MRVTRMTLGGGGGVSMKVVTPGQRWRLFLFTDRGDPHRNGFGIEHQRAEAPFLARLQDGSIILGRSQLVTLGVGQLELVVDAESLVIRIGLEHADGINQAASLGFLQQNSARFQVVDGFWRRKDGRWRGGLRRNRVRGRGRPADLRGRVERAYRWIAPDKPAAIEPQGSDDYGEPENDERLTAM